MKKIIAIILSLACLFVFAVSCGNGAGGVGGDGEQVVKGDGKISPGTMTACAWNDNANYDAWKELFREGPGDASDEDIDSEDRNGHLYKFLDDWGLNSLDRVKVSVMGFDGPVGNVKVQAFDLNDNLLFTAKTDNAGDAFLFPRSKEGYLVVEGDEENTEDDKVYFNENERTFYMVVGEDRKLSDVIQLMFVIDATGSMGDEMDYLKVELGDVIKRVAEGNNCKIYLSFLFYRDNGDKEKFAYSDFSDVTEPGNYKKSSQILMNQTATGGGDYPEALDEALLMATRQQWSDEATKIIFHLYDAPAHEKKVNKNRYKQAVLSASEKGIRICPVLASGANDLCEYLARQSAIYTGGTYVWITDESGVGNDHYDPDIDNVVVEKLNELLIRLINGYRTGVFADPVWYYVKDTESSSDNKESEESIESSQIRESYESDTESGEEESVIDESDDKSSEFESMNEEKSEETAETD